MKVAELLTEAGEKKARYKISWEGYHGNPKPEIHGLDYFSDDLGFDKDDVNEIKSLSVGQKYVTGGPADSVTIVRMSDGPLKEAATQKTAAEAIEAGLTKSFEHKVSLSNAMQKALSGLIAKGKLKDLGECVFDVDTLGRANPKSSYFTADPKNPAHKLQLRELPHVKKMSVGKAKEGYSIWLFKHSTLPVIYVVSTDGESGTLIVDRLELANPVSEAVLKPKKESRQTQILNKMSDLAAKNFNIHHGIDDFRALFIGGDSKGMRKLADALDKVGFDDLADSYERNKLIWQKLGVSKSDFEYLVNLDD